MMHRIRSRPASFAAALLLAGALAACADAATVAVPAAPAFGLYPAPNVSATYPGGQPLIRWDALTGAISYDVVLEVRASSGNFATAETSSWTTDSPLGSTSGTSLLADLSYSGMSECFVMAESEWYHWTYRFRVTATFADGTSSGYTEALVATC